MTNDILKIEGIAKSFGGVQALSNVNIAVKKGTIHAIIGPNGSGKTTLINVITGFYAPSAGRVLLSGANISGLQPYAIARLGVARTFQNLRLFNSMNVEDNVKIPLHSQHKANLLHTLVGSPMLRKAEKDNTEFVAAVLEKLDLTEISKLGVASLPYGQRRMVEIARALCLSPQLLLLDEPVAGMNANESLKLIEKVKKLVEDGTTVILIEHDMQVVMKYSDVITVLHHGQVIAHGSPAEIQNNQDVVEAYLGKNRATTIAGGVS